MFIRKALFACAVFIATPALAESPLDGTWKMVIGKAKFDDKPVEVKLVDGQYSCVSCEVPYTIKADGTYQKRPGPAVDESSVQLISDRMVKITSRKDSKLTGEGLLTVAPDGATRKLEYTDYTPNGLVTRGTETHRRVGAPVAGAHSISGQWRMASVDQVDDAGNLMTFATAGDTVTMTTPDGYGYVARIGGPAVKVTGDRTGGMVQLSRPAENVFVETSSRDGKVRIVNTITIRPDGTASVRSENRVRGGSSEFELVRQ